jgi:predicted ATP-grasp superfamily ATP-dependent carboligase
MHNQTLDAQAVILTGEGDRGALDYLRSLARENIGCVVVSTDEHEIASRSRYCRKLFLVQPYRESNDSHNVKVLVELGKRFSEKPVLIYGEDINMLFVSRNRDELQKYYRFLMPPRGLAEKFVNKTDFQRLAETHDIPVPKTRIVHSYEELVEVSKHISYPAFIKPAFTMNWSFDSPELRKKYKGYKFALRPFRSAEEMLEFCRDLPLGNGGVLVQEFIEGSDREIFSFHGYFDEHSRPLAYFVGRKIRTFPMHHGGSTCIETVDEPTVAQIGITSLQKVNFCGIVKIDMKKNPLDGTFKILEVNPRYTLWESLGAFAGMNLCTIAFHHQRGEKVEPVKPVYAVGYKWLFFKQDFRAFVTGYWRAGEWTLWQYLNSLRGKKVYQLWDWKDPLPLCYSAAQFWVKQARKVLHKVTGR